MTSLMPQLRDGTPYKIRQVQPEDVEGVKYYQIHAWVADIDEFLGTKFTPEAIEARRKSFLRMVNEQGRKAGLLLLGAFCGGNLIGQASLQFWGPTSTSRLRFVGNWGIFVRKEYQNQGVGEALLLAVEQAARDFGLHKLAAEVVDQNDPAKALYVDKLGYIIEGRKKEHFCLDSGEFADLLVLGKVLN